MKKIFFPLSMIATMSTAAYAQSDVALYGNVDMAVAVSNNGAAGAANVVSVTSGNTLSSYFGMRGSEDLAGGLKARFVLQAGFDGDTGAAKTYAGNPATATPAAPGGVPSTGLFNMRSFVGIEGGFGSVSVGRDYTPMYWILVENDPFRLGMYGNLQAVVQLSGTGSERFGRGSNAVFYVSPLMAGFQARAMYSMGSESPGGAGAAPKDANHLWDVSGRYAVAGLVVAGSLQQLKLPLVAAGVFTGATGTRKIALLTAKYGVGAYSLSAGYLDVKQPMPNNDARDYWLGGSVPLVGGAVTVLVQKMRLDAAAGAEKKATVFGVGYLYPLSKRTALFATYGQANNNPTGSFALISGDNLVGAAGAGVRVRALATGIRHVF